MQNHPQSPDLKSLTIRELEALSEHHESELNKLALKEKINTDLGKQHFVKWAMTTRHGKIIQEIEQEIASRPKTLISEIRNHDWKTELIKIGGILLFLLLFYVYKYFSET